MGVGREGNRRAGNYGISVNISSHGEFTEGAVTIGVGCIFQYFTTPVEKDDFLRRRRLGPCRTLKGRVCGIKKRLVSRPILQKAFCIRLRGLHGGDACVRSADPADVVVPHMAVGRNPLRTSAPTAGFAPYVQSASATRFVEQACIA